jgi:hypothetical protein
MQAILCHGGAVAFARSVVSRRPISFSKFRVGRTVGFTPSPRALDVDEFVYEGGASKISVNYGSNNFIVIIEMTLDSNVGDFEVGNIMVFDDTGVPFAFGVRSTMVPKIRTRGLTLGSEMNIQMPVRILTTETPANVDVLVTRESSLPVVETENAVVLSPANMAEYPVYMVENFKASGRPALLYARTEDNTWWANPYFEDVSGPDFLTISGGYVGDKYQIPVGSVLYGFEFQDGRTINETLHGGTFGDGATPTLHGGLVF